MDSKILTINVDLNTGSVTSVPPVVPVVPGTPVVVPITSTAAFAPRPPDNDPFEGSTSIEGSIFGLAAQTRNNNLYNGRIQRRESPLRDGDLAFSYPSAQALKDASGPYNGHVILIMPDRALRTVKENAAAPFPIDYFLYDYDGVMKRCDQYGRLNSKLSGATTGPAKTEPLDAYESLTELKNDLLRIGFQYAVTVDDQMVWTGFGPPETYVTLTNGRLAKGTYVGPSAPVNTPPAEVQTRQPDGLMDWYPSTQALVDDAKSLKFQYAIVVDLVGVFPGFGPPNQFRTVNGKLVR